MINIYKQELLDDLEDKIKVNSIAYTSSFYNKELSHNINLDNIKTISSSLPLSKNLGLFPLDSILVSVGWNANDDVFTKESTWNARLTAIDKPVNYMHDEKDIIGHMISSIVIDRNGKIISNDIKDEEVPSEFDIVVGAVLYTEWSDEDLSSRMSNLIKEIAEDKWFVSMECLFNDFDYAVISPDGQQKTIARNDKTSFLTKFLRIYGGSGEYKGYKLGRQLKDFIFVGKGIVDNPANKRSIIINNFKAEASLSDFPIEKVNVMDEVKLLARFDAIDTALTKLVDVKTKELTDSFDKTVADLKAELETSKAKLVEQDGVINSLKEVIKEKETKALASELEVKTIKRMTKAALGGITEAEVAKFVETWASVSEEQFDSVLSMHKKPEVIDTAKVISSVKVEEQPTLVLPTEEEKKVRTKASEWLSESLFKKGKK